MGQVDWWGVEEPSSQWKWWILQNLSVAFFISFTLYKLVQQLLRLYEIVINWFGNLRLVIWWVSIKKAI